MTPRCGIVRRVFAALLALAPVVAHAAGPDSLPLSLELARRGLASGDSSAVRQALRNAETQAGAASMLVPSAEIARLHYYAGVLAWQGGLSSQAMNAWREMWHVGDWDPGDDGLLDDEGISVLRALRDDGGGATADLTLVGERTGALILGDGRRLDERTTLLAGRHLMQVRCADGAVLSSWFDLSASSLYLVSCARHRVPGGAAGANDAVLAEDADEDLVRVSLFAAYSTDAAMRLSQLPPLPSSAPRGGGKVEAPAPPAAPPAAEAPAEAPVPAPAEAPAQAEPVATEPEPAALAAVEATPPAAAPAEAPTAPAPPASPPPAGPVTVEAGPAVPPPPPAPAGLTCRGTEDFRGLILKPMAVAHEATVRIRASGSFGLRVRYNPDSGLGTAVRVDAGGVSVVQLPDRVLAAIPVNTEGELVLSVELGAKMLKVRLGETLLLSAPAGDAGDSLAVELGTNAVLGEAVVCH